MGPMRQVLAPVLGSVVLLIAACGGGGGGDKPPPQTSGDQKHIDEKTGKDMSKVDEQAWKEAGLSIPPDADAGSSSGSPPPSASAKPDTGPADECTPAGVDFEKRNRDKLKACYAEGKKKDPNLEGTVRLSVSIDMKGAVKSIKITEKTLPDPVANCMLKVLKAAPFPEAKKCPDKNITIPMTFPTPK
jgi:hypothetical protein